MKKVVVKLGSSVISPGGKLDVNLVNGLVKDILAVEEKGYRVVLVSSGAIACGLNKLKIKRKPQDMHSLMAISSFGQIILMDVFNEKFNKYKRGCAQILLTWDDFDNRSRFINVRKTIDKLLAMRMVPIINENDVVSCEEIRVGDNDRLSAFVSNLIGAEQLIILSDVEGLYDGKTLLREVPRIDSKIMSLAKREDKTHTAGGMFTKLDAAKIATDSGIKTVIASGHEKRIISRVIKGEVIGTLFFPPQKIKGKKRWIASKSIRGMVCVDDGAKDAVLNRGKSLLNVGITGVNGIFKSGDAVMVVDSKGVVLGSGLVNYNSCDLSSGKQKRLEKEVIHRDNFVKAHQELAYHPCGNFCKKKG